MNKYRLYYIIGVILIFYYGEGISVQSFVIFFEQFFYFR